MTARSALRSAAARPAEAGARLDVVRQTREKARAFEGEIAREVEGLVGVAFDISAQGGVEARRRPDLHRNSGDCAQRGGARRTGARRTARTAVRCDLVETFVAKQ
jgi:hypothetical protein